MKIRMCIPMAMVCLLSTGLAHADDIDGPAPPCCSGLAFSAISVPSTKSPLAPYTFKFQHGSLPPDYVTALAESYEDDPFDSAVAYRDAYHSAFGLWSSVEYRGSTNYTEQPDGWIVGATSIAPEPGTLALLGAGLVLMASLCESRVRKSRPPNPPC
jgi:hypothetical protein